MNVEQISDRVLVAGKFRLDDLTVEQLEGLKWLLASEQVELTKSIASAQDTETFWRKRIAQGEDHSAELAVVQENLANARRHLADALALVPIVYGAKFVAARRRSK
jgi:hypothetical protein